MTIDEALQIYMNCGTSNSKCQQCAFFLQNDCSIKFKQFMVDSIKQHQINTNRLSSKCIMHQETITRQQAEIEQLKANQDKIYSSKKKIEYAKVELEYELAMLKAQQPVKCLECTRLCLNDDGNPLSAYCGEEVIGLVTADTFCSYGKRKEVQND